MHLDAGTSLLCQFVTILLRSSVVGSFVGATRLAMYFVIRWIRGTTQNVRNRKTDYSGCVLGNWILLKILLGPHGGK